MEYKQVKAEVGCLVKIGALVEKMMQCGICKHYEQSESMCANPAHELPEHVEITELCGHWALNARPVVED